MALRAVLAHPDSDAPTWRYFARSISQTAISASQNLKIGIKALTQVLVIYEVKFWDALVATYVFLPTSIITAFTGCVQNQLLISLMIL